MHEHGHPNQPRGAPPEEQPVDARIEEVDNRLAAMERRVTQLENTLKAVARSRKPVGIGHPCNRCGRSRLLMADGMIRCPVCGFTRSE